MKFALNIIVSLCLTICAAAEPLLIKTLSFENNAGQLIRFGDVNADGQPEIAVVQNRGQRITCVTLYDLNGTVLWQKGTPDINNYAVAYDLAIQLYDFNGDGKDEVILVWKRKLLILNGLNGKIIKSVKVPYGARDAIYIAPLVQKSKPAILLKDRYRNFYIYDQKLNLYFRQQISTGHYPTSYDFNHDGIEELLIGYHLYDVKNKKSLWKIKLPGVDPYIKHNDGVSVGDVNADGQPEIAIACSKESLLVNKKGKRLFSQPTRHSQHALILPGESATYFDRVGRLAPEGEPGILYSFDYSGQQISKTAELGFKTLIRYISGWSDLKQNLILATRMTKYDPSLFDSQGNHIAEFTLPLGEDRTAIHSKHFDILGDAREEVILHSAQNLYIYSNNDPITNPENLAAIHEKLPNRRIYNDTFYTGGE